MAGGYTDPEEGTGTMEYHIIDATDGCGQHGDLSWLEEECVSGKRL